ncbi:MAG: TIGR03986 family CRISPR-associated RAMP protein [Lachnospiraceae bacterium]|nr:TIGR03986 family CRISPR-associated RAMP protein [Lachnospiraceae bacterium]
MEDWKQKLEQLKSDIVSGSKTDNNESQNQKSYNSNGKQNNGKPNHGKQNNGKPNRESNKGSNNQPYVGAPYNFIPFYDKVYKYPEDKLTSHNDVKNDLITGEITYEVKAETPIMIDDGTQHFFTDAKGRYAIPGSTMRGLIRNNVQILGLSSFDEDIDDYALMYRKITAKKGDRLFEEYKTILGADQIPVDNGDKKTKVSVLLNIHAGYVFNKNGKYVIYQTKLDSIKEELGVMNYYVLSERKIINAYLKDGDKFSYGFFRQNGKSILQHEFQEFEHYTDQNNRDHYRGKKNSEYKPYYKPITYEVTHEKDIIAVGYPGENEKNGYVVSTGYMNEKKAVYIIPEIDKTKESIPIPEEDVRAFKIDLNKKKNTLKQFGGEKYFDLPEEGEMRPVFYIRLDGRLYFGFTPRLRLFYDHTLKEGLKPCLKTGGVDYAKALFGYTSPEKSYKSKLSFSDAVIKEDKGKGAEKKRILAEPKPTSYLDYLKQNKSTPVTYNTDGFELRGVKQYWLHESFVPIEEAVKNENAASTIRPLREGTKFKGKIRFRNLTKDELGLLLWAVRLNGGSQMNVGKAKSYGYGRISVTIEKAKKMDLQRAYRSDGLLCLDPFCNIEINKAIDSYKEVINQYLGKKTIDELPHIRDFFIMKDSGKIPHDQDTRYMNIDQKEYQNRQDPLPTVKTIVNPE